MNTIQHTPLPWTKVNDSDVSTSIFGKSGIFPREIRICNLETEGKSIDHIQEMRANAAFIVDACNSHYKLIEELRLAKEECGRMVSERRELIAALQDALEVIFKAPLTEDKIRKLLSRIKAA